MIANQKAKPATLNFSVGSTGGLLRAAEVEERYVISWESKKQGIFESPTGGATVMKEGDNLVYYAKKEQCLAVGVQLQTYFKISDYSIYRIFANGQIQYLHPKDGEFPEKVNQGRIGVGNVNHSIGQNVEPIYVKFTGRNTFDVDNKAIPAKVVNTIKKNR